nr:ribosomal protein L22 [Suriana maritima]
MTDISIVRDIYSKRVSQTQTHPIELIFYLKQSVQSGWKKRNTQIRRVIICIVVGDYGTKNKSTRFQTRYNPKSSFSLVCTTKKLF